MGSETGPPQLRPSSPVRLAYIDNLRVLMTALVILLHLSITYGAPGDWYYNEVGPVSDISFVGLTLFVALNQAFFLGFFFMISSYLSPASLERKGAWSFFRDRLMRLGIPIAIYVLVVNPLLVGFLLARDRADVTLVEIVRTRYTDLLGFGPTWFLEALLVFSIGLVAWYAVRRPAGTAPLRQQLPDRTLALFALGLGLATFVVRIWLPVGWWLEPVHFQLAHFPQYVTLFVAGVAAWRRGWFETLTAAQARRWAWVVAALVAVFPIMLVSGGAADGDIEPFLGGIHWQQLVYAIWEQVTCVAIIVALLVLFRTRFNSQNWLARAMSRGAFATYVIHAPIITLLAIALAGIELDLALKFVLVAPLAVGLSFLAGFLIKQLPVARGIV